MTKVVTAFLIAVALLATAQLSTAQATGNIVGKECTAAWVNNADPFGGGTITTDIYVAPGVPTTAPATPMFSGLPGSAAFICRALAPGQYTAWAQAVDTFSAGGVPERSPLTLGVPFVLTVLPAPSAFGVRAR